jgi:hypothetical protein
MQPGSIKLLRSVLFVHYLDVTEEWQGQSDLDSSDKQALKVAVNGCSQLRMSEKSLTFWNNITLWRHCCLLFFFFTVTTQVLPADTAQATNLMTFLNQLIFKVSLTSKRYHKPIKGKTDTSQKKFVLLISGCPDTQKCRSYTMKSGCEPSIDFWPLDQGFL